MAIDKGLILKALDELKTQARGAVAELKAARDVVAIAKALIKVVPEAVALAEKIGKDLGIRGADKKALVVDVLNALIPWPWWIPASIRGAMLDAAIELVVAVFNRFWKK